jgi:hypothetical protein
MLEGALTTLGEDGMRGAQVALLPAANCAAKKLMRIVTLAEGDLCRAPRA